MAAWDCPKCGRRFARKGQGHECSPAMTLEEYFSTGPAFERPVFDAVMGALVDVGPIHVEPVSVGIFLKRAQSFAELRPATRWVSICFGLRREVRHPLITRKVIASGGKYWHYAHVSDPEQLDEHLVGYLTEAYLACPPA